MKIILFFWKIRLEKVFVPIIIFFPGVSFNQEEETVE